MSKPLTVGEIRKAIARLANDTVVMFGDISSPDTGYSVREIESIKSSHDGRYGLCVTFVVGSYAAPWGTQSYVENAQSLERNEEDPDLSFYDEENEELDRKILEALDVDSEN